MVILVVVMAMFFCSSGVNGGGGSSDKVEKKNTLKILQYQGDNDNDSRDFVTKTIKIDLSCSHSNTLGQKQTN